MAIGSATGRDRDEERQSLSGRALGRVASGLEGMFFGVGRGGLDALGLEGHDIKGVHDVKGFEGSVAGPDGKAMDGATFLGALGRMDRDGLDPLLGKGFEEHALGAGREMFLRGVPDRDRARPGIGRGE